MRPSRFNCQCAHPSVGIFLHLSVSEKGMRCESSVGHIHELPNKSWEDNITVGILRHLNRELIPAGPWSVIPLGVTSTLMGQNAPTTFMDENTPIKIQMKDQSYNHHQEVRKEIMVYYHDPNSLLNFLYYFLHESHVWLCFLLSLYLFLLFIFYSKW